MESLGGHEVPGRGEEAEGDGALVVTEVAVLDGDLGPQLVPRPDERGQAGGDDVTREPGLGRGSRGTAWPPPCAIPRQVQVDILVEILDGFDVVVGEGQPGQQVHFLQLQSSAILTSIKRET